MSEVSSAAGAASPSPPSPFAPTIQNRPARASRSPVRVVSFNSLGGIRLEGIVKCLTQAPLHTASLVLLCESDFGTRRSGRRKIASEIAQALGMSHAYLPEYGFMGSDGEIRSYFGNAILSAAPLEDITRISLPAPTRRTGPRSERRARRIGNPTSLVARTTLAGRRVTV